MVFWRVSCWDRNTSAVKCHTQSVTFATRWWVRLHRSTMVICFVNNCTQSVTAVCSLVVTWRVQFGSRKHSKLRQVEQKTGCWDYMTRRAVMLTRTGLTRTRTWPSRTRTRINITGVEQVTRLYACFTSPTWTRQTVSCFVRVGDVNWPGDKSRQFSVVLNIFQTEQLQIANWKLCRDKTKCLVANSVYNTYIQVYYVVGKTQHITRVKTLKNRLQLLIHVFK